MRTIPILLFSFILFKANSQNKCDPKDFQKLIINSRSEKISDSSFKECLTIVKQLEQNKCSDYDTTFNGQTYSYASLTYLFGEICLKKNDSNAVVEYINYMKRNINSSEEQISFSFEHLFVKQPEMILSIINFDKSLLNQLVLS